MRQYVYDGDLDGRDLLTFIYEYKIKELLIHPLISALVKEIWNSPYKITGHIFNASSIHVMTLEWRHNKYDMEQALRFYKWPEKDAIKSINSHWFQFQVWWKSGRTWYYIDFVFCLGMAILLHALVSNVIDVSSEMYEGEQKYGVLNTMLKMELYKGNAIAVD